MFLWSFFIASTSCSIMNKDGRNLSSLQSEFALPIHPFVIANENSKYVFKVNDQYLDIYPNNPNVAMKIKYLMASLNPGQQFNCKVQGFLNSFPHSNRQTPRFHIYALNDCQELSVGNKDFVSIDRITPGAQMISFAKKKSYTPVKLSEISLERYDQPDYLSSFYYFFAKKMSDLQEVYEEDLRNVMEILQEQGVRMSIDDISPSIKDNKRLFYYNLGKQLGSRKLFINFIVQLAKEVPEANEIISLANKQAGDESILHFLNNVGERYIFDEKRNKYHMDGPIRGGGATPENVRWAAKLANIDDRVSWPKEGENDVRYFLAKAIEFAYPQGQLAKFIFALHYELEGPDYMDKVINEFFIKK